MLHGTHSRHYRDAFMKKPETRKKAGIVPPLSFASQCQRLPNTNKADIYPPLENPLQHSTQCPANQASATTGKAVRMRLERWSNDTPACCNTVCRHASHPPTSQAAPAQKPLANSLHGAARKLATQQPTNHKPQTTTHKPQPTNHKPQPTNHNPQPTNHKPQTTNHKPANSKQQTANSKQQTPARRKKQSFLFFVV